MRRKEEKRRREREGGEERGGENNNNEDGTAEKNIERRERNDPFPSSPLILSPSPFALSLPRSQGSGVLA